MTSLEHAPVLSLGLAAVLASLPIRLNSDLRTLVRLAGLVGLAGLRLVLLVLIVWSTFLSTLKDLTLGPNVLNLVKRRVMYFMFSICSVPSVDFHLVP